MIFEINSNKREQFIDITRNIQGLIKKNAWQDGILLIHTTHTTAGLTINENADPDVKSDMLRALDEIVPNIKFKHMEGNSDSHIKSSLMGSSLTIPVSEGKAVLGIWQGIYFCEFDGPRDRKVVLKFVSN